jgi:hypothetical protein
MKSFSQFVAEMFNDGGPENLDEALITFGGKAYPKFGNIVIMAGGAGSGKGFVKDKLLGIEGITFDVDHLKLMATRIPTLIDRVKDETGFDLSKFDTTKNKLALKDPESVANLHYIIGVVLQLDRTKFKTITQSVFMAPKDRKPNLIFDVTMKDMRQFNKYTKPFQELGYDKKNIHIVWVINDVKVAKEQNERRARTVPVDILFQTHAGAALTMREVIKMGDEVRDYLDGDIVFAFNRVNIDSSLAKSERGGQYVADANYVYVKRSGKPIDEKILTKELMTKISYYVPDQIYSQEGKAIVNRSVQKAWKPK